MDNIMLERYLRTIGKRTYINCFYLFQANYNKLSDTEIGRQIPIYDTLSSNNNDVSLRWKASAAIGIFKNRRELDAVNICLSSSRLDNGIIKKANKIISNYCIDESESYQIKIEKAIKETGILYKDKTSVVKKTKVSSEKYIRDPQVAAYAKYQAKYKCELKPTHETFISGISNNNYVEAHHLVPIRYQDKFEHPLDIPENIVALCPNCHRAIHHANIDLKKEILKSLYIQRESLLRTKGIVISFEQLLEIYQN